MRFFRVIRVFRGRPGLSFGRPSPPFVYFVSAVTSKPASCGHFKTSHSEGGLVIGLVGG